MTTETAKRTIVKSLWFSLAGLFLAECWLWDHGKIRVQTLTRRDALADADTKLRNFVGGLSPVLALVVFLAPIVLLSPILEATFGLMGAGYVLLGLAFFVAAQAFMLSLMAYLLDICRGKIFEMTWVAVVESVFLSAHDQAERLVAPAWARHGETLAAVSVQARALFEREKARFVEKWTMIRTLVASKAA